MRTYPNANASVVAKILTALLFAALLRINGLAQETPPDTPTAETPATSDGEKVVQLEKFTVFSMMRVEKAIDHIPGSVVAIPAVEIAKIQLSSMDTNEILAQTVPGFTASNDDLYTKGELLRGRAPLILLDGVVMSTPLREVSRVSSAMIDPAYLDRVEVVNGSSAMEGVGGSGGLINYVTKSPTHNGMETTLQANLESQFQGSKLGWKGSLVHMDKEASYDYVLALGQQDRPMYYDAHGNLLPLSISGSYMDSYARSIGGKLGFNFGNGGRQRLQASISNYELKGNNNYNSLTPGNRAAGIPQSAVPGPANGTPSSNLVRVMTVKYVNPEVLGGTLTAFLYKSHEQIVYNAGVIDPDKQDPNYAPIGTLVDQSEIVSTKRGLKLFYVRPNLFVQGLQLNTGYDFGNDRTLQDLLLTGRGWLPEINYTAHSGYAQLDLDLGKLSLSGGGRYQAGGIKVPTYHTLYMTSPATNGLTVIGGHKNYTVSALNLGAVYRFTRAWSAFVGYSQGYDLPDIGTVLRDVETPNQSVNTLTALDPVLTSNYETGINWHSKRGSLSADIYYNHSPSSTNLITDVTTDHVTISRTPFTRKGFEFTGEWKFSPEWKVSGTYSREFGYTANAPGLPLDVHAGQSPDKAVLGVDWKPAPRFSMGITVNHFSRMELNVGRFSPGGTNLYVLNTPYTVVDGSAVYHTKSRGDFSVGCSNLTNTYHILTPYGKSNTNYFSIKGRVFTISYTITH